MGEVGWNWLGDSLSEQGAKSCHRPHNDCSTGSEIEPDGDPHNVAFIGVIVGAGSIATYADDGDCNHDNG